MKDFTPDDIHREISHNLNSYSAKLDNKDFERLSEFITSEFGIKMPAVKKVMLQSRLQKRLKELGIKSFSEYIAYIFSKQGLEEEEVIHMIDVVSTNKTDFFRENIHFEFLIDSLLPDYHLQDKKESLKVWSCGCSSGEEPYTLAIVLSEYQSRHHFTGFIVFATDISTRMLKTAVNAIYKEDRINNIPLDIKKKYFLKSKNTEDKKVRIVQTLRDRVIFSRLNLIDDIYSTPFYFDIVFCRNVLIYFDRFIQEKILLKICSKIKKGGYLFLGHSESIVGMNLPLKHIKPTIFMKV